VVRRRVAAVAGAAFTLAALAALPAAAQRVVGTVRDSASREPIAGAAVLLLDANGAVVARTLSSALGQFSASAARTRRLRVVRIGFRPREVSLPPAGPAVVRLDVEMLLLPTLLEAVDVRANPRCPPRADRGAAFALLEQARAGLLASVVERDGSPARLVRLAFDRSIDAASGRIVRHSVRIDSSGATTASFVASHTAGEFARRGFMRDSAGVQHFYGPDADVLLDDAFATAYCFRLAADTARPTEIGLAFEAADRRRGRVDVDGTLWVDTVARALRDVEFHFVGLPDEIMRLEPGGMTGFREVRPGIVLVDRWSLRLVGTTVGTTFYVAQGEHTDSLMRSSHYLREAGGVLARATWPDGYAWRAPLGSLHGRATRLDGSPAAGVELALVGARYHKGEIVASASTPYSATVDANGSFGIQDLISGPYAIVVLEPRFTPLGYEMPAAVDFSIAGDSAVTTPVSVPTAEQFVHARCRDRSGLAAADSIMVFGRVMTASGTPIYGVDLDAAWNLATEPAAWFGAASFHRTATDGLFFMCQQPLRDGVLGDTLWLSARYESRPLFDARVPVTGTLTVVPLQVRRIP
jgi:hypothetical protein